MSERGPSVVLAVTGMSCAGCAATVQRVLSRVPGVRQATVDLAQGRAIVAADGVPLSDLVAALEAAGYGAGPWPSPPGASGR